MGFEIEPLASEVIGNSSSKIVRFNMHKTCASKKFNKEPLHIETSYIRKFKELERDYISLAMAPKRSLDERKLILHMHERGNLYYEISIVIASLRDFLKHLP
jgi:hypothetical protein